MQNKKIQYYMFSFLAGLTIAIFFMAVAVKKDGLISAMFAKEYFENFGIVTVDKMAFWKYVLWNRFKWLIIWFLIGQVRNYEKIYILAVCGVGMFLGITLSAIVMNYKSLGIGIFLAMVLPHGIFYYFSAALIVKKRSANIVQWQRNAIIWGLIILSLLLGATLESLFTPILVDKICKIG